MMKKMRVALMIAAAMTAAGAVSALAQEETRVEANGIAFEIPAQYKDLVTVETEGLGEGELVRVSETASVKAAEANGENTDGAGWLFTITRKPEAEVKQLRGGAMDGMEIFAENDDFYYIYEHPTDVRFTREQYDDIEEDMAQWSALCEWASGEVRENILMNTPGLEKEIFTNTTPDMYFARAAYNPAEKFVLRTLEHEGKDLDPHAITEDDFAENLAEDMTFEMVDGEEAPDGEYIVMYFEEDDVRIDFFLADENLVRVVTGSGDGQTETLFRATCHDDDPKTTTGIVKAWCDAIVNGGELDD